jgi:glycosyltransferase involved in cell wall biosynthesis
VDCASRRIEQGGLRVIYSSSPPYSAHLVARKLKRKYNLPWVADFRDPWTQLATYHPSTPLHARLDKSLEWLVLSDSDAVVANTETNKANLVDVFRLPAGKVHVIPNGFDPDDFRDQSTSSSDRFEVSCLGKFYEMPDPGVFFRAYRRLSDAHGDTYLRLLGWYSRATRQAAQMTLKPGTWEMQPRVEHDHAVRIMKQSAILLVNLPNSAATHWVPGKLYEYLAAGRPILFVGPPGGDAADIVRRTGAGLVSDFDESNILAALEMQYQSWRQGYADWAPVTAQINHFNRRFQAQGLAEILDSLIAGASDVAQKARLQPAVL